MCADKNVLDSVLKRQYVIDKPDVYCLMREEGTAGQHSVGIGLQPSPTFFDSLMECRYER